MTLIPENKYAALFNSMKSREYRGHKLKVHTVGWNADGRKLASGSVDRTARIWHPERSTNPKDATELRGHTDSVDQLCWDPSSPDRLATASIDKTVRIWDARNGKCVNLIQTTGENINISWSPDGRHIAVGSKDDLLSIIDTETWKVEKSVQYDVEVNEIAFNKSGNLFYVTTGQGTIKVLQYPSLKLLHTINAHTSNCFCLELDPREKYLATGSADALVSLWDLKELICVRTFGNLDWPVRTISFSHDGEFLASASEDFYIDIAHIETGESAYKITCNAAMNTVAWHPHKYLLAYAGDEVDPRTGVDSGNIRIFGFSS